MNFAKSTTLEDHSNSKHCRICLISEPLDDLILPCKCSHAHRTCLDRWRSVSPHPDAMSKCEICLTDFEIEKVENEAARCYAKFQFGVVVLLDVFFIVGIFVGLWIGFGFLGDMGINNALKHYCHFDKLNVTYPMNTTTPNLCNLFSFTGASNIWLGRVWFWGFVLLFFLLGIIGCFFFCCCREKNPPRSYESRSYYDRSSCYWWWCGPSYYNGYYYSSPYGYYGTNDILCCYLCCSTAPYHHHHTTGGNWSNCNCSSNDCSDGCTGNCDKCDGDSGSVLVVILLIIVAIIVICGIVFTVFIALLIMNKIIKRHMHILERQSRTQLERIRDREANSVRISINEEHQGLLTSTYSY